MANNQRVDDHYTNLARKEGYLARSIYKLQEIDEKYQLFDETTRYMLDVGCAPGSWLQYISQQLQQFPPHPAGEKKIIGFDIKQIQYNGPYVSSYEQDVTDREQVRTILAEHDITTFDVIVSDMAPDTMGRADIDAMRSIGLIEKTLRLYEQHLSPDGKFVIKVFMGPGFDELIREMKSTYGASNIVVFKPKACRKASKETYIVKRR